MAFCQTASRAARAGLATATALPTRLPARTAAFSRSFSTTAPRLALPPPPPPPPPSRSGPSSASSTTGAAAPWPPSRPAGSAPAAPPRKATGTGAAASAAAAADPLKDLYSSDNPAQWALWSTDDFYKRHLGNSGGADSPKQHLRLRPTTGRTVHVSGNVDQARAFVLTEALVRRNNIKGDHIRQRFHERPGLRRKRLRSQRWGKRFRENFIATAKRVQDLAAQGW